MLEGMGEDFEGRERIAERLRTVGSALITATVWQTGSGVGFPRGKYQLDRRK